MLGIMAGMVSFDPLYLTVTCSEVLPFFWKLTSGWFPYSALLGWTVDTCVRQSTSSCFLPVAMHLAFVFPCLSAFRRRQQWQYTAGFAGDDAPRAVFSFPVVRPKIWQSLVRCWSCLRCTGLWTVLGDDSRNGFPYSTLLGPTVDTSSASFYEACWKIFTRLQFVDKVVDLPRYCASSGGWSRQCTVRAVLGQGH